MKHLMLASIAALLVCVAPAQGAEKDGKSGDVAANDKKFVMQAARDGLAEVELGELAATQATSASVREYGQHLKSDHAKANEKLKEIAKKRSIELPTALNEEQKSAAAKLKAMRGEAFDRAYLQQMISDHRKAIELFEKQAQSASDDALKEFAAETLPTLRSHLEQAQDLEKKIGAGTDKKS